MRAKRGGIYPGADAHVGKGRGEGQRGARRRLPVRDVGHQQRRVAGVGDAAHAVLPCRQVCSERGNDPESERSRHAWTPLSRADVRPVTRHAAACDLLPTRSDAAATPKSPMNAVDATRIRTSPGPGTGTWTSS